MTLTDPAFEPSWPLSPEADDDPFFWLDVMYGGLDEVATEKAMRGGKPIDPRDTPDLDKVWNHRK